MKRKKASLQKLVRVQKLMHDLAQWRHARVEHEKRVLEQDRASALEALGGELTSYGALGAAAFRYAHKIDAQIAGADVRLSDAAKASLVQGARVKVMSEALNDANRALKDFEERKALSEIIDACVALTGKPSERNG